MNRRILVVCYGNLCRSPMAEGLLRDRLPAPDWEIISAGTHAVDGRPPSPLGVVVLERECGINIGDQRSSSLLVGEIATAEHILTMSVQQARIVAAFAASAADRIRLLGAFDVASEPQTGSADPGGTVAAMHEIVDPMGGSAEEYRLCVRRLERAVDNFASWVRAGADPGAGPLPTSSLLPRAR